MADEVVLMDPARSRVLLIGSSRFGAASGLHDLRSVAPGVQALRRILIDPRRGGLLPGVCRSLIDPASTAEVGEAFWPCVEEAEHTLLIYYAGHGLPDPHDGALHLAVRSTNPRRVHTSAVPIEWIRRGLLETAATTTVVILDCCYAGRVIRTMSASDIAAEVDVAGSYVMVAAPANRQAVAPEGEAFTAFTGALVGVLGEGVPSGPPKLDLDTVFKRVRTDLVRRSLPAPEVLRSNDAARLALVRNVAPPPPPPRSPPPEVPTLPSPTLAAAVAVEPSPDATEDRSWRWAWGLAIAIVVIAGSVAIAVLITPARRARTAGC